jgi:hypothetical protein
LFWARIGGEFFVIVLGVPVALPVDAWNDARLDRIEEAEYLVRLEQDLRRDTAEYRFILDWMDRKETSLRRLDAVLNARTGDLADTDALFEDLSAASNFGWNVGSLSVRATFEDLRSSGKLGLLRDPDLRGLLVACRERSEGVHRRIEARRTQYPDIAYRLVPSSRSVEANDFGAAERMDVENLRSLLATLRESELPSHVVAETNRALFIRTVVSDLRDAAVELLNAVSHAQLSG